MHARRSIRFFMLAEAILFIAASLVHRGLLLAGYEHGRARIAETVLASVLILGLLLTWFWPARTRVVGITAQAIALLGTFVGIFTVIVGIGPQSTLDLVYHGVLVALLLGGLAVAIRARP